MATSFMLWLPIQNKIDGRQFVCYSFIIQSTRIVNRQPAANSTLKMKRQLATDSGLTIRSFYSRLLYNLWEFLTVKRQWHQAVVWKQLQFNNRKCTLNPTENVEKVTWAYTMTLKEKILSIQIIVIWYTFLKTNYPFCCTCYIQRCLTLSWYQYSSHDQG